MRPTSFVQTNEVSSAMKYKTWTELELMGITTDRKIMSRNGKKCILIKDNTSNEVLYVKIANTVPLGNLTHLTDAYCIMGREGRFFIGVDMRKK